MPLTHRLASKIEETPNVGSGKWNKVTVFLPNKSYALSKVELQNGQLSIVFDFSDNSTYDSVPFSFLLSGFGIDVSLITDNTKYLVIGIQNPNDVERNNSLSSFPGWYETNGNKYDKSYIFNAQRKAEEIAANKCPPNCQPPPVSSKN